MCSHHKYLILPPAQIIILIISWIWIKKRSASYFILFHHSFESIKAKIHEKIEYEELNTHFCVSFHKSDESIRGKIAKSRRKRIKQYFVVKKKLRSSGGEFKVVGQTIEKKELRVKRSRKWWGFFAALLFGYWVANR